jgi:hypothetical protein
MNYFRTIYKLSFYVITLITFVFGGAFQYLFGISNTLITFLIVVLLHFIYFLYAFLRRKVVLNGVVVWSICYLIIIIVSAIFNRSNLISTFIYFIFPALPLGVFLFCYINFKEGIIKKAYIYKLFYYIALLQLPILLLQKNFYNFFIQFNNSGQKIDSYDFMFGSFFIKSDHSLAIFIIFSIIIILVNKKDKLFKFPILSVFYLAISVFLTESNISKLFLSIILAVSISIPIYKKYKSSFSFKLIAIILGGAIFLFLYSLRDEEFVKTRLGGAFESQYSLKSAEKQFELTTAKRGQILIVVFNTLETKWIGEGPYSYFNILTGQFTKTKHFTQLIWTYFDLGIIGLIVVMGLIISIIKYLDIDKGIPFYSFLLIFTVYAFYTTVFSDIAIMFSIFMTFNKKNLNEFNNYTISRLEKKS